MGDAGRRGRAARDRQRDHPEDHEDRMNVLPIIVGLFAAVGVWLIVAGVRGARTGDAATLARQRLARQEIGLGQSAVALELEKPLGERLLMPLRRWFTSQVMRLTPAAQAA